MYSCAYGFSHKKKDATRVWIKVAGRNDHFNIEVDMLLASLLCARSHVVALS